MVAKLAYSDERGFTLIELMLSMAIMAVLSGLAITTFWVYKEDAEYAVAESTLRSARNSMEVGDQDVPAGFALPLTWTTDAGGPVPAAMAAILPEMATAEHHKLGAIYRQCTPASPPLQVNQFLASKPCRAKRFVQWVRFCNGIEVFTPNIPGPNC